MRFRLQRHKSKDFRAGSEAGRSPVVPDIASGNFVAESAVYLAGGTIVTVLF